MILLEYGPLVFMPALSFAKTRRHLNQFRPIYLFKPIPQVPQDQLQHTFIAVVFLNWDICSSRNDLLTKGLQTHQIWISFIHCCLDGNICCKSNLPINYFFNRKANVNISLSIWINNTFIFRINFPKAKFSRQLTFKPDFLVSRNCDWGQTLNKALFSCKHLNDGQIYKVLSIQQLLRKLIKSERLSERCQCATCNRKSDYLFCKLKVGSFANSGPNRPMKILRVLSEARL